MKKKLLSLVLAGAMVASTSVSAFAADSKVTTEQITISSSQNEKEVPIEVTGNVLDSNGNAVAGTIKVTVPTATTFSVTSNGDLESPQMTIRNDGDEQIVVTASSFEDLTGEREISLVPKFEDEQQSSKARNEIWLRLKSKNKYIGLTSEANGGVNGKIYDANYAKDGANCELGRIDSGENMTLEFEGKGGTTNSPLTNPIKDSFKLVLKIKRARTI